MDPARTPAAEAELCKEYVETFAGRERFMEEVCRRVESAGVLTQTMVGAPGDGHPASGKAIRTNLPNRIEILGFYHAV